MSYGAKARTIIPKFRQFVRIFHALSRERRAQNTPLLTELDIGLAFENYKYTSPTGFVAMRPLDIIAIPTNVDNGVRIFLTMKPGDEGIKTENPANMQVHLAWLRTIMALERTLDAWVRTAAALIGFGFTIVQFFERFIQMPGVVPLKRPHLARYIGLLLIGIGTLAQGVAIWQYQKVTKYLRSETFRGIGGVPRMRRLYPSLAVAVLICLVGLLAFVSILVW